MMTVKQDVFWIVSTNNQIFKFVKGAMNAEKFVYHELSTQYITLIESDHYGRNVFIVALDNESKQSSLYYIN